MALNKKYLEDDPENEDYLGGGVTALSDEIPSGGPGVPLGQQVPPPQGIGAQPVVPPDTEAMKARKHAAELAGARPDRPHVSLLRNLAALSAGFAGGYANATGKGMPQVNVADVVDGVRYGGYNSKVADWQKKSQDADAQATNLEQSEKLGQTATENAAKTREQDARTANLGANTALAQQTLEQGKKASPYIVVGRSLYDTAKKTFITPPADDKEPTNAFEGAYQALKREKGGSVSSEDVTTLNTALQKAGIAPTDKPLTIEQLALLSVGATDLSHPTPQQAAAALNRTKPAAQPREGSWVPMVKNGKSGFFNPTTQEYRDAPDGAERPGGSGNQTPAMKAGYLDAAGRGADTALGLLLDPKAVAAATANGGQIDPETIPLNPKLSGLSGQAINTETGEVHPWNATRRLLAEKTGSLPPITGQLAAAAAETVTNMANGGGSRGPAMAKYWAAQLGFDPQSPDKKSIEQAALVNPRKLVAALIQMKQAAAQDAAELRAAGKPAAVAAPVAAPAGGLQAPGSPTTDPMGIRGPVVKK